MTFNPSIPQPKDIISDSQGDLLTNNSQLNIVYGTSGDHVAFDAASNRGRHKKVTFVSQGSDPDTDSPSTAENEIVLFALEDGTDTEIYLRQESQGTVSQVTKDGELFLGMYPVFCINISDLTPNANTAAGGFNFTVNSSFNFDAANSRRLTANRCHYRFVFTNQVVDDMGNPTNAYMFYANGFRDSANPVLGKVPNNASYNAVVDPSFIDIIFVNQSNATVSTMTGATIMCWRVQ